MDSSVGSRACTCTCLLVAVLFALVPASTGPAQAPTAFTVNTTADAPDADPGNVERSVHLLFDNATIVTGIGATPSPDSAGAAGAADGRTVAAADPLALVRLGQIGGTTLAMDSDGRYVYFGVGPRLAVANVDDPRAPRKIGESEPLGDLIRDVVVGDRRAVVAVGAAGLAVVDIADPSRPTVVARLDTPGYAWSVALWGRLYVADGPAGLRVIELEDGRPREVGALKLAADALRVAATADYVYVLVDVPESYEAGNSWGLIQVVDVREPGQPHLVEVDDSAFSPFSVVAVDGDRLYAAGGWNDLWLTIFDLTKPGNPTQLTWRTRTGRER